MTRGHPFGRCFRGELALVESLSSQFSLQLNPSIYQHVSSRKALLSLKTLPKLLGRMTALIPKLLESFSIGINGTAGLLCMAPFGEALGGDKLADCLLPNVEVSGYSRNRSSLLMQGHHLLIQSEAALSRTLSTSEFAAGALLPEGFCRLCMLIQVRTIEKTFHHFPKIFEDMPAIKDLLSLWSAVGGSPLIVFGPIAADDFDSWMLP